jgi:hypothetical protein
MIPTGTPNNPDSLPNFTDDGRPHFVDAAYDPPDDLGDWWLDLGRVDLPGQPTV